MAGNGGKRLGAGRPKGSKSQKTLEKEAVMEAFNQRVMLHADTLFNAQLQLARGSMKVFRIDEEGEGDKKRKVHVHVTDAREITKLLDEHDGNSGEVDGVYYYFTDVPPDNRAIDSMLNRTFGKPKETHELTGKDGEAIKQTIVVEVVSNDGKPTNNEDPDK